MKHMLLIFSLIFTSVSFAESSWYCETGDPGGGGPTASIEKNDENTYVVQVDYNRRDLESANRSTSFEYEGLPVASDAAEEQGMKCTRLVFARRGQREVHFFICDDESVLFMRLKNFNKSQPDFELNCQ